MTPQKVVPLTLELLSQTKEPNRAGMENGRPLTKGDRELLLGRLILGVILLLLESVLRALSR